MVLDISVIDWAAISAVVAFLGVMATVVMIFYTRKSLNANEKQLDEMKRQWNEEREPHLVLDFIFVEGGKVLLVLENIGRLPIKNLSIKTNEDFFKPDKENEGSELWKKFWDLEHKKISIAPTSYKVFVIGNSSDLKTKFNKPIEFTISYDGKSNYTETFDVVASLGYDYKLKNR